LNDINFNQVALFIFFIATTKANIITSSLGSHLYKKPHNLSSYLPSKLINTIRSVESSTSVLLTKAVERSLPWSP